MSNQDPFISIKIQIDLLEFIDNGLYIYHPHLCEKYAI